MVRVETTSKVRVYEYEGETVEPDSCRPVEIKTHWNRREFVVISVGDSGSRYTVLARDLINAVNRANLGE